MASNRRQATSTLVVAEPDGAALRVDDQAKPLRLRATRALLLTEPDAEQTEDPLGRAVDDTCHTLAPARRAHVVEELVQCKVGPPKRVDSPKPCVTQCDLQFPVEDPLLDQGSRLVVEGPADGAKAEGDVAEEPAVRGLPEGVQVSDGRADGQLAEG